MGLHRQIMHARVAGDFNVHTRRVRGLAGLLALSTALGGFGLAFAPAPAALACVPGGPCGSTGLFTSTGTTVTCTYATTGEDTFSVPAGVTSVHVDAVGGSGGAYTGYQFFASWNSGNSRGADVSADLTVTPDAPLYVEVGGNGGGQDYSGSVTGAGGFNGGAAGGVIQTIYGYASGGYSGAGGGGASDVRTSPMSSGLSPDPRLLVAGGGGGAASGSGSSQTTSTAGFGGDAGSPGSGGGSGGAGTSTGGGGGAGGGGGVGVLMGQGGQGDNGSDGTLGSGGAGGGLPIPSSVFGVGGGGGGGGLYGGGGGGDNSPAGGGGGGSSYSSGDNVVIGLGSPGQAPQVAITYTIVPTAPAITSATNTTFVAGTPGTFTVTTTGVPSPSLSGGKGLPPGVTFTDNGDGTATIAYDGSASALGTSPITISASNGVAPDATQHFSVIMAPPPAPTGVTANAGSSDSQIGLNWNAVAGATSYKIYSSTTSGGPYTLKAVQSATSWPNNGLTPGTTYYYVVNAVVPGAGSSPRSTEVSATTPAQPAATNVTATTASSSSIGLSWTAVTATGATGPTAYNVYSSTTAGGPYTSKAVLSTTTWPNNGLTPGTTYYYVVKAVVPGVGSSVNSAEASATTLAQPVAPVVNAAAASRTSIHLSWNAVTATGATGSTSYDVYSSTTAGGPYTLKAVLSTTTWPNNGLTSGMTYYYVVKAVVPGVGSSPLSTPASATTT